MAFYGVLLPISTVIAVALVSQGVIQNFRPYDTAKLVESQIHNITSTDGKTTTATITTQAIAQGPVASQEAIKMLGTNGGGFFNANSAHPFEKSHGSGESAADVVYFSDSAGLTATLGQMTHSPKHGWAVFAAMSLLFFAGVTACYWSEAQPNLSLRNADVHASAIQSGGNMEGKEVRFGVVNSVLFATITTDASCGAVNAMHDSFTPRLVGWCR